MDFVGYDTCEELICTSCDRNRVTNKFIKQVIPKTHINKISPLSTLDFCCYPHKYTCDILSEELVSSIFFSIFLKKREFYWGK